MVVFEKVPMGYETLREISNYLGRGANSHVEIGDVRCEKWKDDSDLPYDVYTANLAFKLPGVGEYAEKMVASATLGLRWAAATSDSEGFAGYCHVRRLIFQDPLFKKRLLKRGVSSLTPLENAGDTLNANGIRTIGDLVGHTKDELFELIEPETLDSVQQELADCNLSFRKWSLQHIHLSGRIS
jgi:hypothetical protein